MKKRFFKIVSIISLASILLMSFFPGGNLKEVFETKKAEAVLGVGDTVFDIGNFAINLESLLEYIVNTLKEVAVAELKKQILDQLVNQVIQWIQGGGKPKFVTDFDGFLKEAGNNAVGQFAENFGLEFLCSPFNLQLRFALFPVARFGGSGKYSCTLDTIVANIEDFKNDFREGGWIAFDQSYEPQNNFFGVLITANMEKNSKIAEATSKAVNEVNQASGFLSGKDCEEDPSSNAKDEDNDGKKGDILSTCKITTPGKQIGDITSKMLGSDFDYIVNANGVGEYVAAIADAAINSLIISGAEGLLGAKNGHQGQNVQTDPCSGLTGRALQACRDYQVTRGAEIQIQINIIKNQIEPQLNSRNNASSTIITTIQKLDNYLIDINKIAGEINLLSCPSKANYLNEIKTEIDYASTTRQVKIDEQKQNNLVIADLNQAMSDLDVAASSTDQSKLAEVIAKVQIHISNPTEGDEFAKKQEDDLAMLETRIDDKLTRFNGLLSDCKAGK